MRRSTAAMGLLAASLSVAMTATAARGAPAAAVEAAAPTLSAGTATTAPIRYLTVSVKGGVVTMPSRVLAGTYYVHVTTTDAANELQAVRPPNTLTTTRFTALWRAWVTAPASGKGTAYTRWRTSATFVGGATVQPHSDSFNLRTPAGVGTFAVTLAPGRYWFYAAAGSGQPRVTTPQIRQLVVVGTATRTPVPVSAVARFASSGAVTLPRRIPAQGFVLGVGAPGWLSTLGLRRLLPGITDQELTDGTCLNDGAPAPRQCFASPGFTRLGGAVSGGASALWYFRLPPGDYALGQMSGDAYVNVPFSAGAVSRVTVG